MGQAEGLRAEHYFMSELNSKGIPFIYADDWYDFEINKQKVEVKSCRLFHHNWKKKKDLFGRFKFTSEENREKQYAENVWVCFILRYKQQHLFLGFVQAKSLEQKAHISIRQAHNLNLLTFDEWINKVLR